MRRLIKSLSRAQRACKPALGMLLILAAIAALPVASLAQVTPIQSVTVIFGENRSFDHVFGTYVPQTRRFARPILTPKTFDECVREIGRDGEI